MADYLFMPSPGCGDQITISGQSRMSLAVGGGSTTLSPSEAWLIGRELCRRAGLSQPAGQPVVNSPLAADVDRIVAVLVDRLGGDIAVTSQDLDAAARLRLVRTGLSYGYRLRTEPEPVPADVRDLGSELFRVAASAPGPQFWDEIARHVLRKYARKEAVP